MYKSTPQGEIATDLNVRLKAARSMAQDRFAGLSETQLNWRPSPKAWSVAECLEHLTITADRYKPKVNGVVGAGAPTASPENPVSSSWVGGMLISAVGPTVRRKVRAPGGFNPQKGKGLGPSSIPPGALGRFSKRYAYVQDVLAKHESLDWHNIKLTSPVSRLVRLRLADCFTVLVLHAQRHLNQADRVMNHEDFPTS